MKNVFKMFILAILLSVIIYSIFIIEESIRLKSSDENLPLVLLDERKCNITDKDCHITENEYEQEYWSLGYVVKIRYLKSENSSDLKLSQIIGKEFLLFNKIRLWAWIS